MICPAFGGEGGYPVPGGVYPSPEVPPRKDMSPEAEHLPQKRPWTRTWGTHRKDLGPEKGPWTRGWGTPRMDLGPEDGLPLRKDMGPEAGHLPPETTLDQRLENEPGTRSWSPPSPYGETDAFENIASAHPSDAVGKNVETTVSVRTNCVESTAMTKHYAAPLDYVLFFVQHRSKN